MVPGETGSSCGQAASGAGSCRCGNGAEQGREKLVGMDMGLGRAVPGVPVQEEPRDRP